MITTEIAQGLLEYPLTWRAESVSTLRRTCGDEWVNDAIALMHKLGGPVYFDDAIRQRARQALSVNQPLVYTLARDLRARSSRILRNPMSKRIPLTIVAHRRSR